MIVRVDILALYCLVLLCKPKGEQWISKLHAISENDTSISRAVALFWLGSAQESNNEVQKAFVSFQSALQEPPHCLPLRLKEALWYSAAQICFSFIQSAPSQSSSWLRWANIYFADLTKKSIVGDISSPSFVLRLDLFLQRAYVAALNNDYATAIEVLSSIPSSVLQSATSTTSLPVLVPSGENVTLTASSSASPQKVLVCYHLALLYFLCGKLEQAEESVGHANMYSDNSFEEAIQLSCTIKDTLR